MSVIKIPQLSIELLNIFRNDPQGGSILKRPSLKEDTNMDQEEDEEESAYNEHFKNSGDKPGPGEFRVPSVRVRAQGPPGADIGHQQAADYTGTATEQGKHDSGEIFQILRGLELHCSLSGQAPDLFIKL